MARRSACIRTIARRRIRHRAIWNNNTPVARDPGAFGATPTIDTVMVYAKLYPQTLVEEYRKAGRAVLYIAPFNGRKRAGRNPTN